MRRMCLSVFLLAALTTGCADHPTDNDNLGVTTHALTEHGPQAIGLLAFLNHSSTTLDLLDHEVPLNRRAARNLIHHRNGWDKILGTFDDNLFSSVAEVDAVRWVGPSAMDHLIEYAAANGWVPDGDELLGVWDGVSFTAEEAELTLEFVNKASHELLDEDLSLDRRAADSIVAAQPVDSIETLAGLYYVGGNALQRLKEAALGGDILHPGQVNSSPHKTAKSQFAADFSKALTDWYAFYGAKVEAKGGNSQAVAQASISVNAITEIMHADDDPYGHDLSKILVLSHPGVVFPNGDLIWYGAYDRESLKLIEVYTFE
jgi:hypothetical protein